MTASLTRCIAFLRGFNGAHDDWAEEIERLDKKCAALAYLLYGPAGEPKPFHRIDGNTCIECGQQRPADPLREAIQAGLIVNTAIVPPTRIPDPTPCCPFCGQVHGQQPCRTLRRSEVTK